MTTPQLPTTKRRDSNLELYRIIVMLLIVAHHYVVNSGLLEVLTNTPFNSTSAIMAIFGAWGKTGINCFVLITGYFMCRSKFTWRKLLKLYLQIIFYAIIIYAIFLITGHTSFSAFTAAFKFFPVKSIATGFTSCFLLFFMFIPFINIFLHHLDKRMHLYLVCLLTFIYSVLPSTPFIPIRFNYVEWFVVLYFVASYIRFYGNDWKISHKKWGVFALISLFVSATSIMALLYLGKQDLYFFIADSNKLLALATAITSFMWFKGLKIKYSPFINGVGATTFGVLLIHANSDTMRQWLWKEIVDCVGHFGESLWFTLGYALSLVLLIFFVCSFIDWLRIKFLEKPLLKFSEKYITLIVNKFKFPRQNIDSKLSTQIED